MPYHCRALRIVNADAMRIIPEEELYQEEIERRALTYFETARSEGSLLSDDAIMAEARALAKRDIERTEALAHEEVEPEEEP